MFCKNYIELIFGLYVTVSFVISRVMVPFPSANPVNATQFTFLICRIVVLIKAAVIMDTG